jgi:flagellar protein FliS
MNPAARDEYLTTEVLTAAPQKLQLLLIDGAIRFGRQAELHWRRRENEAAFQTLVRCQEIVTQMISGLAENLESPLVRQVSSVYAFIYRVLVSAAFHHDANKLAEALRVLEIERETWRQVCDRLGTKRGDASAEPGRRIDTDSPLVLNLPVGNGSHSSLSFEA